MKSEDDSLREVLVGLPLPELPHTTFVRTLARARGALPPPARPARWRILHGLPAHAVPAILLSADAVFVADSLVKMGRVFRG